MVEQLIFMWCIILAISTCAVCYFIVTQQTRKNHDSLEPERQFNVSNHQRQTERYLTNIRENRRLMLGEEDYDFVFKLMQSWYIRLREIHRHDETKQREIISDWLQYLDHTNKAMVTHDAWSRTLQRDSEDDRKHWADQERFSLELEEIENRFARLLGKESELEGCRLKVTIKHKYFPECSIFDVLLAELYGTAEITDVIKLRKLEKVLETMCAKGEKIIFHQRNKKLITTLKAKLRIR